MNDSLRYAWPVKGGAKTQFYILILVLLYCRAAAQITICINQKLSGRAI
jgi:hypothetical protein